MGMFSEQFGVPDLTPEDQHSLMEAFVLDDITHEFTDDQIKEFCAEGGALDALVEAGTVSAAGKGAVVAIGRGGMMNRRKKLAAFAICRRKNKSLWNKLVKTQKKRKALIAQIMKMYGSKAEKQAKDTQKAYEKEIGRRVRTSFRMSGGNLR